MRFTLTVRIPNGGGGRQEFDLLGMRSELASLARVLDALVPGETVTIERLADAPCGYAFDCGETCAKPANHAGICECPSGEQCPAYLRARRFAAETCMRRTR